MPGREAIVPPGQPKIRCFPQPAHVLHFHSPGQLRSRAGRTRATGEPDRIGPAAVGGTAGGLRARCAAAAVLPRQVASRREPDQGSRPGSAEAVDARVKPAFDLGAWSRERLARVESALERWVVADAPAGL